MMDPDLQEALSRKHSLDGVTVRRLKSGAIALYDQWCRLIEVTNDLDSGLARAFGNWDFEKPVAPTRPTTSRAAVSIVDLEELGL
jgi:hypothetical protein